MNKKFNYFKDANRDPAPLYIGCRIDDGTVRGVPQVLVKGDDLYSVFFDNRDNPDVAVFEWGYRGKFAKNLSASILFDFFQSDDIPDELVQIFTQVFISNLPFKQWSLSRATMNDWIYYIYSETDAI